MSNNNPPSKIPVGISSCLLGEKVRYNGGHTFDPYINHRLADYFEFFPVCPEVGIGLSVPRTPIRLVNQNDSLRVLGSKDPSIDVTDQLTDFARKTATKLDSICGYIFKSRSPSCGMERVKTFHSSGMPAMANGTGQYARTIMEMMPNMPTEEEGRLRDPDIRDNFIDRVYTFYRWQQLKQSNLTPAQLIDFHARHKLVVMAHNQAAYKRLGQLVAGASRKGINQLAEQYEAGLMSAMRRHATRKQHTNVLQHLQGYFSKFLADEDRHEMTDLIGQYYKGLVPLEAPLTLIRHHLRHHPNEWALHQTYLNPYPRELI